MSLADLVRSAVALGQQLVEDGELEETVSIDRWISQDDTGKPSFTSTLQVSAIVLHKQRSIRLDESTEVVSTSQVIILEPFSAVSPSASGREEPIDKRDRVTLANGRSGPILMTENGIADVSTGRPYVVKIYLG